MAFRSPLLPALILLIATLPPALAQAGSDTLSHIRSSGSITIGHRNSSIPFSYVVDGQVTGYAHDLTDEVLATLRQSLNLPQLAIKEIPVTSRNRLTLVENGTVDLECGSTTHNRERESRVSFSNTFFIAGTRLATRKDSAIQDFSDLAHQTVVTTAGTTSERLLQRMNSEEDAGMNIIAARDHGESFMVLESGRASAFVMDDALLYGEIAKARRPEDWRVTGTSRSHEAYACTLRKGDDAFKAIVDQAISNAMRSGRTAASYQRWFTQPIPPASLNLNFPISPAMQKLFEKPNDRPFD